MAKPPARTAPPTRRMRGFEATAGLIRDRIRAAGASRGFAVTRLLTHWPEIVGAEVARVARPVKVGFRRDGLGATLTVLTTGAQAPMLEMQKETIRERVNACYGYAAISKVLITQTAPSGFAEGQATFEHAPAAPPAPPRPDPALARRAAEAVAQVGDDSLRAALEDLGRKVLARGRAAPPAVTPQETDPTKGPI